MAHGHNTEVRPGSNAYRRKQENEEAAAEALARKVHRLEKAIDMAKKGVPWSHVPSSIRHTNSLELAEKFVKNHKRTVTRGGRRTRRVRKTRRKH